ncbi:MAG: preprotein translocase subunit SecE [Acidimicrobiaceae bacterium]|nr:preprotein translocase subunit SecE [Acidimicrobiaceae bacterium]
MNRETKRLLQRQGQIDRDGQPVAQKATTQTSRAGRPESQRTTIKQFFSEVRTELKRVDWASRKEVRNYATVVLLTLTFLISLIFGLNVVFSRLVIFLFK